MPEIRHATDGDRDAALVFISYSRRDRVRVDPIVQALEDLAVRVWVDRADIPFTADFVREIEDAIARCSLFVFLISTDSITSRMCQMELDRAADLGKRIAPVLLQEAATLPDVPVALSLLNFIPLAHDERATAQAIEHALSFDQDYLHRHTWLVLRARRWRAQGRRRSDLLRGSELNEAETWLTGAAAHEPQPTEAQRELISSSRRGATLRRIVLAVGILVLLAAGAAGFHLQRVAESDRAAQQLAAAAKQIDAELDGQGQPEALAKALATARESMMRFGVLLPPVKGAVLRTLARSLEIARWEHPGPQIQDLRADGPGARMMAAYRGASDENTFRVGDPLFGVASVDAPSDWVTIPAPVAADHIELCPGGECVSLKDADGRVLAVLDAEGASVALPLRPRERAVAVDRAAGTLVVATRSTLTAVRARSGGRPPLRIPLPEPPRVAVLQPGSSDHCLVAFASGRAAAVDLRSGDLRRLEHLDLGAGAPFAFSRDASAVYFARAGGELMRYAIDEQRSHLLARVGRQRIARIVTDAVAGNVAATTDTEGLAWVVSPDGTALLAGPVYVGVQPSVAFGKNGLRLAATSYLDATIRVIEIGRQATRIARVQLPAPATSLSFCSPHGPLVIVDESGGVAAFDAQGNPIGSSWSMPAAERTETYCDGAERVVALSSGEVTAYSLRDGAQLDRWSPSADTRFNALAVGDAGGIYAAAFQTVYRLTAGGTLTRIGAVGTDDIHHIAVDEVHDRFMIGSSGAGHVQVGRLSNGVMLGPPIRAHMGSVMGLAAGPRSERFASVGTLGTDVLTPFAVWSLNGDRIAGNTAHLTIATAVAIDPLGQFLVTGGSDGKVRMWDQELLQIGYDLASYGSLVPAVAVSAEGLVATATAGPDAVLEIHDVRDRRFVEMLESLTAGASPRSPSLRSARPTRP